MRGCKLWMNYIVLLVTACRQLGLCSGDWFLCLGLFFFSLISFFVVIRLQFGFAITFFLFIGDRAIGYWVLCSGLLSFWRFLLLNLLRLGVLSFLLLNLLSQLLWLFSRGTFLRLTYLGVGIRLLLFDYCFKLYWYCFTMQLVIFNLGVPEALIIFKGNALIWW